MADKSSDAVFKSAHRCNHVWPVMDSLPKNFELTHFQKVSQVQDVGDLKVLRIKDQLERLRWNSDYLPEDPRGPPAITNICKEQSQCEAGLSKTWGGFGQ